MTTQIRSLLELIKCKMGTELCNVGMKTTVPFAAISTSTDSDRLDNLENKFKRLTEQVG